MTNKTVVLFLLSFLTFSCQRKEATQSITTYEVNPADSSRTGFSEYFELEKYIILESSTNSLMYDIRKIYFTQDKIFIMTWGETQVLIFDINGKFINRVSRYGRGPNEYLYVVDMFVSPKGDTIGLYDKFLKKILYYDNNGNYLKTIDLNIDLESFTSSKNGNLIGYPFLNHNPSLNDTIYQLWHFDSEGKILEGKFPVNKDVLGNSIGVASTFNLSSSGLYYIPFTENVVYKITEDPFQVNPLYKLDLKDKTIPPNLLQMPRKEMNKAFSNSYMLFGEFIGVKNLLVNMLRYENHSSLLAIINLSNKKYTVINKKYLLDELNEIPIETGMQNLYFNRERYVAIVDRLRLKNLEFANNQSIGYKLNQITEVTDNPVLLIYKEK